MTDIDDFMRRLECKIPMGEQPDRTRQRRILVSKSVFSELVRRGRATSDECKLIELVAFDWDDPLARCKYWEAEMQASHDIINTGQALFELELGDE